MKKLMLAAAAAASFGMVAFASVPASAQINVRIGDSHHGMHNHHHPHCRTVTQRVRGPHGRMIVKTRRICN